MTHYKITLLLVILPLLRRASLPSHIWSPFKYFCLDFVCFLFFPCITWAPIIPGWACKPSSAWLETQTAHSECVCNQSVLFLIPNHPKKKKKGWQHVKTWCVEFCRFRHQAVAFRLWERAEQYICNCQDQGKPSSAPHGVDPEQLRAPDMSPCSSEHVYITRSLRAAGIHSAKRCTFSSTSGVSMEGLLHSWTQCRFIMWWCTALWNDSMWNQTQVFTLLRESQLFPPLGSRSINSQGHVFHVIFGNQGCFAKAIKAAHLQDGTDILNKSQKQCLSIANGQPLL